MAIPTEYEEQCAFVAWFKRQYPDIIINHSPNEGARKPQQAQRLINLGMCKGFPDLIIMQPMGGYHGLLIEMKRTKGGRLTPEQYDMLKKLNNIGYFAVMCKGFDEARKIVLRYMAGNING